MLLLAMTPMTTHRTTLSSAESRRQMEESIERAMTRYKSEFEAMREKSARLRALREAHDLEAVPVAPTKGRRKA